MATIYSEKLFRKFEQQFRPFIEALDIPEVVFTREDVEVSDVKYIELLETVASNVNPYIGLDIGESLTATDLGVLGHALAATDNIGDAFKVLTHYIFVFAQGNTIRLDYAGNKVICTYTLNIFPPNQQRQDAEFSLAYFIHLIRDLSKREFHPDLIEFAHSPLADVKRHRTLFGCEVMFERRSNRIHFDKKILDYPVVSADRGLLKALKFYLDSRLHARSDDRDILAKTRHLISSSLGDGAPDLNIIASHLGLSGRSLQRRLSEKDIVFSDLVDSVRRFIAVDYVLHTDVSLTDVALILGYGELSSFSRAFKRWTAKSPQHARETGEVDLK